jgi:hypothetical protein
MHTKEITSMALDESAVSALLDALCVGEGTDAVCELAQWALQQLIDIEAAAKIGADPGANECETDGVPHAGRGRHGDGVHTEERDWRSENAEPESRVTTVLMAACRASGCTMRSPYPIAP